MAAPIRFWFDFISPFAYLAWKRLPALAAAHARGFEPVPVLFAAMLDHHGHLGPAEILPKRGLIFKQCLRRAARRELAFAPPPAHPFNPLLGLRIASLDEDPPTRVRIIDRLYDATWAGGPGIDDPTTVAGLLDEIGLAGAELVARAGMPDAKQRLRTQTEQAIAAGVFGVPSFWVDDELFWGDDAIEDIESKLRGEDPELEAALARWSDLPSSAQRRGSKR